VIEMRGDQRMNADTEVTGTSRRQVITIGSFGVVGALGLTACGSGGSGGSDASGGDGTSSGSATAPAAAGTTLTKLSAVPVGGAISVLVNNVTVLVSRPASGTAAAFSAVCPHQGCTVAAEGTQNLRCPCHGSTFDPKTGKNLSGPAPRPLTGIPVTVTGGNVVLS
jgi:cytochrome b6-f complex iron-sulfur subunit